MSLLQIGSDATAAAALTVVDTDSGTAAQDAAAGCGPEVFANHTCHMHLDWSPYASDIAALKSATQKVEAASKLW